MQKLSFKLLDCFQLEVHLQLKGKEDKPQDFVTVSKRLMTCYLSVNRGNSHGSNLRGNMYVRDSHNVSCKWDLCNLATILLHLKSIKMVLGMLWNNGIMAEAVTPWTPGTWTKQRLLCAVCNALGDEISWQKVAEVTIKTWLLLLLVVSFQFTL